MLAPSLRKFYGAVLSNHPYGTAALPHITEPAKTQMSSKSISIPRAVFMSNWESSKSCFEIANYMEILDTALRNMDRGKWFESLDEVKRNALNSMQVAICDLYAAAGSAWVNGTLIKRDEVLAKLGGRLSSDSKQLLREAPFDTEELLDSVLFEKGLEKSLKLAKDKSLLPTSGKGSNPSTSGSSKRSSGKKTARGQRALRGQRAPRGRGYDSAAKTE